MASIQAVRRGLEILQAYVGSSASVTAEHDQIWAAETTAVTKEERDELESLGWFFDDEVDCWSLFT